MQIGQADHLSFSRWSARGTEDLGKVLDETSRFNNLKNIEGDVLGELLVSKLEIKKIPE